MGKNNGHQNFIVPKKAYFKAKKNVFLAKHPNYLWGKNQDPTKWIRKTNIWLKMTKNAYFGLNWSFLGQKSYFLREEAKVSVPT